MHIVTKNISNFFLSKSRVLDFRVSTLEREKLSLLSAVKVDRVSVLSLGNLWLLYKQPVVFHPRGSDFCSSNLQIVTPPPLKLVSAVSVFDCISEDRKAGLTEPWLSCVFDVRSENDGIFCL